MPKKRTSDAVAPPAGERRKNNRSAVARANASDLNGVAVDPPVARTHMSPPRASEPTYEEIAEAAYQRYLRRGGNDGQDFEDWLEAERELRSRSR